MSPRALLGLVVEGLSSNLWGLGCPFYCTPPSLGLCLFLFLLGWLLGVLTALVGIWWLLGVGLSVWPASCAPSARAPTAVSRSKVLSSYLHEQGPFHRERHS